jgi:hypothetical protein
MSPSKRNKPDGSDWHQTVSRALLQLKLKANSARSSPSAKAAEDCRRAAGLFEASLAGLESGPSALQAAIEQASALVDARAGSIMTGFDDGSSCKTANLRSSILLPCLRPVSGVSQGRFITSAASQEPV